MRIVIYGAGAIGGYLGGRLSAAGADVTLVGRGKHREVMAAQGIRFEDRATGKVERTKVHAVLPGEEKPPYDVVFITLKAHHIEPNAERIAALRKEGKHEEADKALEEFRKRYPDYKVPESALRLPR